MMPKEEHAKAVRITDQFRRREAMVYDLSCGDVRLTLEVTSRQNARDLEEWHIQAFARQAPERPTIAEPGGTRRDALRAVARAWAAKGGASGFPPLDWDAVTDALIAVRAI